MTVPAYSGTGEFLIDVDEGDNLPLTLDIRQMELRTYQLRFFYPPGAKLRLLYGQDTLPPPQYDLELLASDLAGKPSQLVQFRRAPGPSLQTTLQRMLLIFWVTLVVAVVGLLMLLVRLLRMTKKDEVH
jgi:hypothetical protein